MTLTDPYMQLLIDHLESMIHNYDIVHKITPISKFLVYVKYLYQDYHGSIGVSH